jgi:uncharacterized coiled-coil DUF342 family protein
MAAKKNEATKELESLAKLTEKLAEHLREERILNERITALRKENELLLSGLEKAKEGEKNANATAQELAYDILEIHTELGGLYSHLRRLVNRYNIGTTDTINHGVLSDSQKGNKNNG